MVPRRIRVGASRHLVCGNCGTRIQCNSLVKTLAETRGDGFEFTCKACREVAALVKEVAGLAKLNGSIAFIRTKHHRQTPNFHYYLYYARHKRDT